MKVMERLPRTVTWKHVDGARRPQGALWQGLCGTTNVAGSPSGALTGQATARATPSPSRLPMWEAPGRDEEAGPPSVDAPVTLSRSGERSTKSSRTPRGMGSSVGG